MSQIQSNTNININLKYRKRKNYFDTTSRSSVHTSKAHLREATEKLNVYFKQFNLELNSVMLREIDSDAEPFELKVVKRVEKSIKKKMKTIDAVKSIDEPCI